MTTKQLTQIIEDGKALKLVAQAYTEISSSRLKQIRNLVVKNRYFLNDLTSVYKVVKEVALKRRVLPTKNNRAVSILITSNYHFYGDINTRLVGFFVASMQKRPTDQLIIGKTGLETLNSLESKMPYDFLEFEKDYPNGKELATLLSKIKNYSQILVFYPELQSVMVQKPTFKDITQTAILQLQGGGQKLGMRSKQQQEEGGVFIFEPEIHKILDFFENQVNNLLLQQSFLESELSRTASRLLSMDQAQSNADIYIKDQERLLDRAKRAIINTKLLETYAAVISLKIK